MFNSQNLFYPYFIFSQGELEHKRPKGFFPRTSKKGYTVQVAKHVHRQRQLRRKQEMEALLNSNPKPAKKQRKITYADHGRDSTLKVSFYESEPLPPSSLPLPATIQEASRLSPRSSSTLGISASIHPIYLASSLSAHCITTRGRAVLQLVYTIPPFILYLPSPLAIIASSRLSRS